MVMPSFAEKYFKKGQMVSIVGRLRVSSYDDKDGNKRWTTDVVAEEQHFAESKKNFEQRVAQGGNNFASNNATKQEPAPYAADGFVPISDDLDDDDLPF